MVKLRFLEKGNFMPVGNWHSVYKHFATHWEGCEGEVNIYELSNGSLVWDAPNEGWGYDFYWLDRGKGSAMWFELNGDARVKTFSTHEADAISLMGDCDFPLTRKVAKSGNEYVATQKDGWITLIPVIRPIRSEWRNVDKEFRGLIKISLKNWDTWINAIQGFELEDVFVKQEQDKVRQPKTIKSLNRETKARKRGEFFNGEGFSNVIISGDVVLYKDVNSGVLVTDSPEYGVAARVFLEEDKAILYTKGMLTATEVNDDSFKIIHGKNWIERLRETISSLT